MHEDGGQLKFDGVGVYRGERIDLVVTALESEYPYSNIEQVWVDRGKPVPNYNGLNGKFGNINLQTLNGVPKSGEGNFRFCLVDENGDPITLPSHTFSIYDADQRGKGILEKLVVDLTPNGVNPGLTSFQLEATTELTMACESENDTTDANGVCQSGRTVFHSSTVGVLDDNPSDPDDLTPQQMDRSIQLYFTDTSCWELTYDHYCADDSVVCNGGGNFLFAGNSRSITETSGCTPTHPTDSPTKGPDPTPPVPTPTDYPTSTPTTSEPSDSPTSKPSNSPTSKPTDHPSDPPVDPPTSDCPADIELISTVGVTEIDIGASVDIIDRAQDKSTVTVKLTNTWGNDLDIYYQYKPDYLNEKCYPAYDVDEHTEYAEITLQCYHMKPFTELEICVTDDCTTYLTQDDNATPPQCCDTHSWQQAVCYKLIIWCEDQCPTTERRGLQALRGKA